MDPEQGRTVITYRWKTNKSEPYGFLNLLPGDFRGHGTNKEFKLVDSLG